jgi:MFS family permease
MEKDTSLLKKDAFAAMRLKDFRLYAGMRMCFTFAAQLQTTVIGFYIYQLTHSTVAIAFIGLSEIVPALGLALYGGYIADKYEKRKMLLLVCAGLIFTSAVIFIVTLHGLAGYFPVSRLLPVIYSMLFLNGIARAFYEPAMFAVFAQSAAGEFSSNASGWNTLSWQTAGIIGPMAGGLIYALAGRDGISMTYAVLIGLLVISLALAFRLKKYPAVFIPKEGIRKSISAGIRWVLGHPLMLYAMSLDLFCVLFGGVTALLPVFAIDILTVGAAGLGMMRMVQASGAALTVLMLVRLSPMGRPWRNLLIAVGGFGCCIIGFGLSHNYPLSLLFLFLQGAFDSVSVVIRSALMQQLTPKEMQGRVSAVNSMFVGSSAEIGDFESGMAAKWLGTVPAVIFGGGMTLLIVVFTFFKTRKKLYL